MNKYVAQLTIDWLDAMSTEGLHNTSNDLYDAIQLISLMRKRVKENV